VHRVASDYSVEQIPQKLTGFDDRIIGGNSAQRRVKPFNVDRTVKSNSIPLYYHDSISLSIPMAQLPLLGKCRRELWTFAHCDESTPFRSYQGTIVVR
jgi:hypothetical protein